MNKGTSPTSAGFRPKRQSRPLQSAAGSSTKSTSPAVVEKIQPPYPRPVSTFQPSLLPSRNVWRPLPPPVDLGVFVGGPPEVCPKTMTLKKGGFWSSGGMHSEKNPIEFGQYLLSKYGHDPRDNSQYSAFENEKHGGDRRDGDRNDDNMGPDFDRVLRILGLENTPVTVIRPGLCAPVFCVPKALDDALASMDIDEAERFISSISEEERFRLGLPSSYKGSSCKESDHFLNTFCPIDGPGIVDVELWREYYRQIRESEGFDVDVSVYPGSCIAATIIPMDLCKHGPDFYTFVESMATMALDQFNKSVGVGEQYQFLEIERVNRSFSGSCSVYYITFAATKMATGGAATANSSTRKLFQAKVRETLWGEFTVLLVRPKA